jgi:APA family basic amino acid/polyamine antiporter
MSLTVRDPAALPAPALGLLRVLGVAFGVAVTIGTTIGAGILRTPGEIAGLLPVPALFLGVWIAGAVYALLGAASLAELGTMLPRSGGQYVFARHAFGPFAGFVVGWNDWVATCGAAALVAIVLGEYASGLVGGGGALPAAIAVGVVAVFAMLQWQGVRTGSRAQEITSLFKAMGLLLLVGAAFVLAAPESAEAAPAAAAPEGLALLGALVLAMQAVIYSYDGWTGVLYFSGEVVTPARDIPRAMFTGVLSVMAIYLLINLAFLHVLPIGEMAGQDLVAATVSERLFGAAGDTVVRVLVVVALLSSVSANLLMATRVLHAMGTDGLAARRASRVNAGGTPGVSLAITAAASVFLAATGTFATVLALLAFFFVANYVISFSAVFRLRRREPDAPRPYRAWGYPWTTGLVLLGSLAFLAGAIVSDTRNSLTALALLAASYPVYRWLMRDRAGSGG